MSLLAGYKSQAEEQAPTAQAGTAIEALSANIVDTRLEDPDRITVENATNRIIDVIGYTIGGANAPRNRAVVNLVKDWGQGGVCNIGQRGKVPAHNAAMINNILDGSFDLEVIWIVIEGKYIASHHAAATVPTTLARDNSVTVSELRLKELQKRRGLQWLLRKL